MKTFLCLFLIFNFAFVQAQDILKSNNKQAQKAFELAGSYISQKQYEKALAQLETAVQADPSFIVAYQQLGDINRQLERYQEALNYYKKVLSLNPEFHSSTYYGLGYSELNTGDYQNALIHLRKYTQNTSISESSKKIALKLIGDCEFALHSIKSPVPFNPENLGPAVNSSEMEYLPVVTADEEMLIFTRRVNSNEDFYQSKKRDGKYSTARFLSTNINTSNFNEGAQCISPDGMYLFFTGCNRPDGLGRCDIYVSKREGNDWSKPFNLGAPINSAAWESQPSISADGRTLYFVSSRQGGYGGNDIWKSELLQGGTWSTPVNLGPTINTSYDEQSPFIHPDNQTLYFSSNGWPGLGNKDLFLSRKDPSGKWSKPENLGYPLNTYAEESSLIVSTHGKKAYYASNRTGGYGNLDIYFFDLPEKLRPHMVTYVKGLIIDANTKEVLTAKVKITNLKDKELVFDDESNEEGIFLATMPTGKNYALTVEKEGYLFHSDNFNLNTIQKANTPYSIEIPLQKILVGGKVTLRNIFFDSNKSELLPESETELLKLVSFLQSNESISIEIHGHTDHIGDENSNIVLSENRAKSVYSFLINNKIKASRLSFKGFGESKPVADNNSEEGRQKNRRTEITILKY